MTRGKSVCLISHVMKTQMEDPMAGPHGKFYSIHVGRRFAPAYALLCCTRLCLWARGLVSVLRFVWVLPILRRESLKQNSKMSDRWLFLIFGTISVTARLIADNPGSGLNRKKNHGKKLIPLCSTLLFTAGYFQPLTIKWWNQFRLSNE